MSWSLLVAVCSGFGGGLLTGLCLSYWSIRAAETEEAARRKAAAVRIELRETRAAINGLINERLKAFYE
jgi:hypothetical protein